MSNQPTEKYFHYRLVTPYGWESDEYRVFPVDISESDIDRDWRQAVSEYSTMAFDAFYDMGSIADEDDIEQFYADSLNLSYAEEISAQDYFDGVLDMP